MSDTYQLENDISQLKTTLNQIEREIGYQVGDVRDDLRRTNNDLNGLEDRLLKLEILVDKLKNTVEYMEEKLNL